MTEETNIDTVPTPQTPTLGDIAVFDHKVVPPGWVPLTGQTLSKSEHPEIYEKVCMNFYGEYAHTENFNLPKLVTHTPEFIGYYIYMPTDA